MRGTIPLHFRCLLITALLTLSAWAAAAASPAPDRLLRCVTQPAVQIGHPAMHIGGHRLYAPVRSAMFYTPARSRCGRAPKLRRG